MSIKLNDGELIKKFMFMGLLYYFKINPNTYEIDEMNFRYTTDMMEWNGNLYIEYLALSKIDQDKILFLMNNIEFKYHGIKKYKCKLSVNLIKNPLPPTFSNKKLLCLILRSKEYNLFLNNISKSINLHIDELEKERKTKIFNEYKVASYLKTFDRLKK